MKNLFLTTALLLGLAVNATPISNNSTVEDNLTITTIVTETDAFCTLIKRGNFESMKGMVAAGANINKKSIENNWNRKLEVHHSWSHSWSGLQIADFVSWAVFQKFEHGNDSYFKIIEKNININFVWE